MTIKVKHLGTIDRFNGVDVEQTKYYTKLGNETYIKKILLDKKYTDRPSHNLTLLMSEDSTYNHEIESVEPLDKEVLAQIEK